MAALGLQPKEASGIYFSTEFAEVRLGWYSSKCLKTDRKGPQIDLGDALEGTIIPYSMIPNMTVNFCEEPNTIFFSLLPRNWRLSNGKNFCTFI